MSKILSYIKKYYMEVIYIIVLIMLTVNNRSSSRYVFIAKGVLTVSLWLMPYFLNLRFKIINTVILAVSINSISSIFFRTGVGGTSSIAIIIVIMLFISLVLNIFMVIKEMYQIQMTRGKKRNGLKLAYVLLSFGLLIGTVISSYAHIYRNIMISDPGAFSIGNGAEFSALYFSCTTYFTVGYGDITPISDLARSVSMSQMVFGYVVTCLILPSTLVAFQKLFYVKSKR